MAIGQRIKFFRNKKGLTQKELGQRLGFMGKTSDVRLAQYEAEARIPKQELVEEIAQTLDVSSYALNVPDIDTYIGLMHTFFALEDMYGLKIGEANGGIVLHLDKSNSSYLTLDKMFQAWLSESKKLESGQSSKEEYDNWRYNYPELDTHQRWAKIQPEDYFEEDSVVSKIIKQKNSKPQ